MSDTDSTTDNTQDTTTDTDAATTTDTDATKGGDSLLDAASRHKANGADTDTDADKTTDTTSTDGDDLTITVARTELADIPKNFFDKDGNLTVPALAKAWKAEHDEVRKLQAKKAPEAPEKPEDYDYALTAEQQTMAEKVLQPGEDGSEDQIVAGFRQFAHEKGLSNEVFGDIVRWYIETTAPLIPDPIDQKTEIAKLGQHAQKIIDATDNFGETMKTTGLFTDAEYAEFRTTATSAAGISMLNKIRQHYGEVSIPAQLHREAAETTDAADLDAKVGEIMRKRQKNEITEEQATREMDALQAEYDKLYGTEPGGTSIIRQ